MAKEYGKDNGFNQQNIKITNMRKFATLNSEEADITNIQLHFWQQAIRKYNLLEQQSLDEDSDYDQDFLVEAIEILILVGSSLTQLIGQNAYFSQKNINDEWVPTPQKLLSQEFSNEEPLYNDCITFMTFYDDIRHFGEPKHRSVDNFSEEKFVEYMNTAQELWVYFLRKNGLKITDDFKNEFKITL